MPPTPPSAADDGAEDAAPGWQAHGRPVPHPRQAADSAAFFSDTGENPEATQPSNAPLPPYMAQLFDHPGAGAGNPWAPPAAPVPPARPAGRGDGFYDYGDDEEYETERFGDPREQRAAVVDLAGWSRLNPANAHPNVSGAMPVQRPDAPAPGTPEAGPSLDFGTGQAEATQAIDRSDLPRGPGVTGGSPAVPGLAGGTPARGTVGGPVGPDGAGWVADRAGTGGTPAAEFAPLSPRETAGAEDETPDAPPSGGRHFGGLRPITPGVRPAVRPFAPGPAGPPSASGGPSGRAGDSDGPHVPAQGGPQRAGQDLSPREPGAPGAPAAGPAVEAEQGGTFAPLAPAGGGAPEPPLAGQGPWSGRPLVPEVPPIPDTARSPWSPFGAGSPVTEPAAGEPEGPRAGEATEVISWPFAPRTAPDDGPAPEAADAPGARASMTGRTSGPVRPEVPARHAGHGATDSSPGSDAGASGDDIAADAGAPAGAGGGGEGGIAGGGTATAGRTSRHADIGTTTEAGRIADAGMTASAGTAIGSGTAVDVDAPTRADGAESFPAPRAPRRTWQPIPQQAATTGSPADAPAPAVGGLDAGDEPRTAPLPAAESPTAILPAAEPPTAILPAAEPATAPLPATAPPAAPLPVVESPTALRSAAEPLATPLPVAEPPTSHRPAAEPPATLRPAAEPHAAPGPTTEPATAPLPVGEATTVLPHGGEPATTPFSIGGAVDPDYGAADGRADPAAPDAVSVHPGPVWVTTTRLQPVDLPAGPGDSPDDRSDVGDATAGWNARTDEQPIVDAGRDSRTGIAVDLPPGAIDHGASPQHVDGVRSTDRDPDRVPQRTGDDPVPAAADGGVSPIPIAADGLASLVTDDSPVPAAPAGDLAPLVADNSPVPAAPAGDLAPLVADSPVRTAAADSPVRTAAGSMMPAATGDGDGEQDETPVEVIKAIMEALRERTGEQVPVAESAQNLNGTTLSAEATADALRAVTGIPPLAEEPLTATSSIPAVVPQHEAPPLTDGSAVAPPAAGPVHTGVSERDGTRPASTGEPGDPRQHGDRPATFTGAQPHEGRSSAGDRAGPERHLGPSATSTGDLSVLPRDEDTTAPREPFDEARPVNPQEGDLGPDDADPGAVQPAPDGSAPRIGPGLSSERSAEIGAAVAALRSGARKAGSIVYTPAGAGRRRAPAPKHTDEEQLTPAEGAEHPMITAAEPPATPTAGSTEHPAAPHGTERSVHPVPVPATAEPSDPVPGTAGTGVHDATDTTEPSATAAADDHDATGTAEPGGTANATAATDDHEATLTAEPSIPAIDPAGAPSVVHPSEPDAAPVSGTEEHSVHAAPGAEEHSARPGTGAAEFDGHHVINTAPSTHSMDGTHSVDDTAMGTGPEPVEVVGEFAPAAEASVARAPSASDQDDSTAQASPSDTDDSDDQPTPHFEAPTPNDDVPTPHFDVPTADVNMLTPDDDVPTPHFDVPTADVEMPAADPISDTAGPDDGPAADAEKTGGRKSWARTPAEEPDWVAAPAVLEAHDTGAAGPETASGPGGTGDDARTDEVEATASGPARVAPEDTPPNSALLGEPEAAPTTTAPATTAPVTAVPVTTAPQRDDEDDDVTVLSTKPDHDHDHDDAPQLRPGDVVETPIAVWTDEAAAPFRQQWHEIKAQFVDDPVGALAQAQTVCANAVHDLADALLAEQAGLDPHKTNATPDTESMRIAMRRYREFLDRILAL